MFEKLIRCNSCFFFKQKRCRVHRSGWERYFCSFRIEPIEDLFDVKDYYSLVITRQNFSKTFFISILSMCLSLCSMVVAFVALLIKIVGG
ncbi:MAG: hypothetical protein HEEMFOPI_02020 [Holosporales bacterium]